MAHSETVPLRKPYPLVIGRSECSSNLWGYLCERYGVNPADTVQLVLTEPSRLAEAYMKGEKRAWRSLDQTTHQKPLEIKASIHGSLSSARIAEEAALGIEYAKDAGL